MRATEKAETQSLPADVWVDDEGRLRKMQYRLKLRAKGTSTSQQQGATVSTTMELFDFGTTANVRRPPASQVADFAELLQGRSSG